MSISGIRSNVVSVLSTLVVITCAACGGSKTEAKAPETDPWSDYKGTYATAGAPHEAKAKPEAAPKAEPKAKEAKAEKTEEPAAAPASGSKKASHGMIKGESVSSISLDAFADASKTATKGKVLTTKYVVGPQYEEMDVQFKSGATVQVIRPAANPASDGPAITSPKQRNGGLSKTESGWYDEEADVMVVVTAAKKANAQKTLGTILKK